MTRDDDEQVAGAADAIRRYLERKPNASETPEGVARWWLLSQRYRDTRQLVQRALDRLEASGHVERVRLPGGRVMYRMPRMNSSQKRQH